VKQQISSIIAKAVLLCSLALPWAAAANAQQFSAWSAPVNLNAIVLSDGTACPAVVNSAADDMHPGISKDGLSLFFTSNRLGGSGGNDIWVTQRDSLDDCWQAPKNVAVLNSTSNEGVPNITTDGHWLYFNSNRDGGADLYVSHRQDAGDDFGWETPINLGPTINIPGFLQNGPTHFEDDATGTHFLYYTQKPNPPPLPASNDELYDIYVSTCMADLAACNTQGLWGAGTPVDALNNTPDNMEHRNTRTAIRRRDGLEMIFSTGRPGSQGSEDLWVSTRATTQDQNWSTPVPINCDWLSTLPQYLSCLPHPPDVPHVNSPAFDGGPALSWDGTELYFTSQRTGVPGIAGGFDLYVSKRTKLRGPQ
jgi:hypothetical protein